MANRTAQTASDGLVITSVHYPKYRRYLYGFFPKLQITTPSGETTIDGETYAYGLAPSWCNYRLPDDGKDNLLDGKIFYYSPNVTDNISNPSTRAAKYGFRNRSVFNSLYCDLSPDPSGDLSAVSGNILSGDLTAQPHYLVSGYKTPTEASIAPQKQWQVDYAYFYNNSNKILATDMGEPVWSIKKGSSTENSYFDLSGCEFVFYMTSDYKKDCYMLRYQFKSTYSLAHAAVPLTGWSLTCSYKKAGTTESAATEVSSYQYSNDYLAANSNYVDLNWLSGNNAPSAIKPLAGLLGPSKTVNTGDLVNILRHKLVDNPANDPDKDIQYGNMTYVSHDNNNPMSLANFRTNKVKYCYLAMNGTTTTRKNLSAGLTTFYDYADTPYYIREKAGLSAKQSPSDSNFQVTHTNTVKQFIPNYRFKYDYYPEDEETASGSYSNNVMFTGKCVVPPNVRITFAGGDKSALTDEDKAELKSDGISALINGVEAFDPTFSTYNIDENRDFVAVNEGESEASPQYRVRISAVGSLSVPEWPYIYASNNFQINNNTLSFITDLDLISDSDTSVTQKLFYSGKLYAIDPRTDAPIKLTANIKDTHSTSPMSPLRSFTPNNIKDEGYNQECTRTLAGSAPNGSIKHTVRNLNNIQELKLIEYRDSEFAVDGWMSYQAFWHTVKNDEDVFEQIKIGRIDIKTLNSGAVKGVYVNQATDEKTTLDADVWYDGPELPQNKVQSLWAVDDNGWQLEEILVNCGSSSTGAFNCIYAKQMFATMVGKPAYTAAGNLQRLEAFFEGEGKRQFIDGYMFSYGNTGVFPSINTTNYSSAKPVRTIVEQEYGEEQIEYTIADEVSYDCQLYGRISDDEYEMLKAMIGETAAQNLKMTLGDGAKSVWYLYLDKTSNDVDPSIKIKILDAKACDEFGENWDDIDLQDITERLKRGNGEYGRPEDSDMTGTVIPFLFNRFEKNYYRIKVRFSLYSEKEDLLLEDSGYRVVLGYAAMDSTGGSLTIFDPMANSDTSITNLLPYPFNYDEVFPERRIGDDSTFLKRTCHYFAASNFDGKWRRNFDKEEYGTVYVPMTGEFEISGRPVYQMIFSCVRNGDDTTESEWFENASGDSYVNTYRIWEMNDFEDRSNHTNPTVFTENHTYYVESDNEHKRIEISGQSGRFVNFTRRHGCYVVPIKNNEFYFSMANDEEVDFWADVQYRNYIAGQGIYKSVGQNMAALEEGELYKFKGNNGGTTMQIYDIPTVLGGNWCQMYYKGSGFAEGKYTIKFGSINGTPVDISNNITPIDVSYDNMYGRIEESGVDNRRLRVFIQKASEEGKSSVIPNMYYELEVREAVPADLYTLKDSYYEVNGGFDIGFKKFEIPVFKQSLETIPAKFDNKHKAAGYFYIVNRYKNFGVRPNYTLANDTRKISDGDGNSIELTSVLTDWSIKCLHNDEEIWNTGDKYMRSVFDTAAFMKVECKDNDSEIGTMTYGETGYQLDFVGQPNFGMTITVGNVQRKVYFHNYTTGEPTVSGSITPIQCLTPIYVTYKNDIISVDDDVILVNNTDNEAGYYKEFSVRVFDLGVDWKVPANVSEIKYETTFSDVGEYDSAVYGTLSEDWRKNDENLVTVKSIDAPRLTILVRTKYDERVTRVLDGYKLEYPYGLNDILFSPNEWLTADNINLRFEKIMEDLRYLKYQTKFYLKPPTTYGGYYGDYETILDGVRQRQYGYVPNGDLEIYRKTNENDSIDDENTVLKNCNDMCTDGENNLYACVGSDVIISNTAKYGAELGRVIPYKINEFIKNIDRIEYSTNTDLLYMLCRKTNKLYIFNSYKFSRRNQAMNISYYGEIGGYGGLLSHNKFNNPTDMCISTTDDGVDDIWVCDTGNKAVKRFSIKGQWISTIDLNEIEYDIIGICSDFKNQIHVLTQKFVFTFSREGVLQNVFKLEDEIKIPLMIRPQYQSGFLYVLYEHWVAKYSYDGKFVARFAENDKLTYRALYANRNFDVYISTEKNILRYNDSLVLRELAVTENADKLLWTPEEYRLNKNENVQDAVINTAFQRIYDNIIMYAKCIFGKIVELDSDNENERISDLDQSEYQKILDAIHKERIFVGINELVTVDVLNRSFKQMYDLLELILESI